MAMSLAELRSRVLAEVPVTASSATVDAYLNEAYRELARLVKPLQEFTIPTVAGQRTYACPSNLRLIREARITINEQTRILQLAYEKSIPWPNTTGKPRAYYVLGWQAGTQSSQVWIGLHPVPDQSDLPVTILAEMVPDALTQDTDYPVALPEGWHHGLTYYAEAKLAAKDYPELANSKWTLWVEFYNDCERSLALIQDDLYPSIRDVLPYPGRRT